MFRFVVPVMFVTLCLSTNARAQWVTPAPSAVTALVKSSPVSTISAAVSVKDIDALRLAVTDAWGKMPLTIQRAIFVTRPASANGDWTERASNVFKSGEDIHTYVEPVGYTWKPKGEMFDFGMNVDFVLKAADGKILGGQENFSHVTLTNHMKVQEFFLNLKLSPDGFPPGKYAIEYTLHDQGSDKVAKFALPFTIAE
jgi:hypothetical protein